MIMNEETRADCTQSQQSQGPPPPFLRPNKVTSSSVSLSKNLAIGLIGKKKNLDQMTSTSCLRGIHAAFTGRCTLAHKHSQASDLG